MASNDLSGRTLGEYELVARVGVGGMGEVYEGRHPLIGKRVAVKVLLPSLSNEQELVERFLSEARAVNEIRHRGIVDIFSFGQLPEGARYFVMEFLEGEAFDKIIKKRAPLPIVDVLGWADEMLDALDAAHQAGIIHRDIKPSNLFLVDTGRGRPYVKLLDFGIAKLGAIQGEATPQTRASVILGTPDYISPEQARGFPISPQTDLYAIGCVLFELLTGKRVFVGENTLQTMWMHVENPPPVPSSLRPDLPPELDDVILWALNKKAAERPPSAAVMREQLLAIRATLAPTGAFTPLPGTGPGSQRALSSRTPSPSGRGRALGTPAPRSGAQAPLKTPAPGAKSGGQRSLSGRGRAPAADLSAAGDQTRAAPLTAMAEAPEAEAPPPRSRLPLVLGGTVLLLVAALVTYASVGASPPKPAPVAAPEPVKVEPAKPAPTAAPEPVKVEPAKPEPVAAPEPVKVEPAKPAPVAAPEVVKVEPAKPEPVAAPEPPKVEPARPKGRALTPEQLQARLQRLETQLGRREAQTGQRDNVLRQFMDTARKQVNAATTDAERKEAWSFLGDIEAQLK